MLAYQQVLAAQTEVQRKIGENKLREAVQLQLYILEQVETLDHPRLLAVLFQKLGHILSLRGREQESLHAYESAFKVLNKENYQLQATIDKLSSVSKSYHNQPTIEISDVYEPEIASEIEDAIKDKSLAIKLLIYIGHGYFSQSQLDVALDVYRQVLLQKNIEYYPLLKIQMLVKIAEIYRQKRQRFTAQEYLDKAFLLFENFGSENEKSYAYALQARLYIQQNKIVKAFSFYYKAVALFEQQQDWKNISKVYSQLGQVYLQQNELLDAKDSYEKALDYSKRDRLFSLDWHVYWGLGCCSFYEKNWEVAALFLNKSIRYILDQQDQLYTDEGKITFLNSSVDVFNKLIHCYLNIGTEKSIENALNIAEKAKGQSLSDIMEGRERHHANNSPTGSYYDMKSSSGNSTSEMASSSYYEDPSLINSSQYSSKEYESLVEESTGEKIVKFASNSFANSRSILSAYGTNPYICDTSNQNLKKRVIPKRDFLFFYQLENKLLIWLKKADGQVLFHQVNEDTDTLSKEVDQLRSSMLNDAKKRGIDISRSVGEEELENVESDFKAIAQGLYRKLIDPFNAVLDDSRVLVIVPHQFIWLLPFAALVNLNGSYLFKKFELLYTPSMKAWMRLMKTPHTVRCPLQKQLF